MAELVCEICGGREASEIVLIEGAKLAACRGCARGGKTLYKLEDYGGEREAVVKKFKAPIGQEEIVDDYAKRIMNAREKRGLPLAVIAEKTNEKESYLHAIEKGRLTPTLAVAKKLERELGIKLIEKTTEEIVPLSEKGKKGLGEPTLGDALEFQKKDKNEKKK